MAPERKRGKGQSPRPPAQFTPRPAGPNRGFASTDPERQREATPDTDERGPPQPATRTAGRSGGRAEPGKRRRTGGKDTDDKRS